MTGSGGMFQDMSAKYGISLHPRKVNSSSLSFIMPKDGKRAIVRCRDDAHIHPFPLLNLGGCRALHVDGHQPDAAIHYAKLCREDGILTSLDGGGLRTNTHELLEFIDVAIVAERLCEQMDLTPEKMLDYLEEPRLPDRRHHHGRKGPALVRRDRRGSIRLPAMPIPRERVIDTNGAGDVFHGAYVYSYLAHPGKSWHEHFDFARAASTFKIQRLGNEAGLPTLADIEAGTAGVRGQGLELTGSDFVEVSHGARLRRRQHQHGCGGDGGAPSASRRDRRRARGAVLPRRQGRQPGGRRRHGSAPAPR